MPIEVGDPQHWTKVTPVTDAWKTMAWTGDPDNFRLASALYYVDERTLDPVPANGGAR
jgi:hypothetical protein